MTRELVKLRNQALRCVCRDLEVNGIPRRRVVTFTADMVRIRERVMWLQTGSLDIHLSKETFDPMFAYLEAARLLEGSEKPLFGTGTDGTKRLSWVGVRTALWRIQRA